MPLPSISTQNNLNYTINGNTITNSPTFTNPLNIQSDLNDFQNQGLQLKIGLSNVARLLAFNVADLYDGYTIFTGNNGANSTPIGGGAFKWNASSNATPDNVMVVNPVTNSGSGRFIRAVDERFSINVLWCGAISSDTIDNTAAFTLARSIANNYNCPIYVPSGRFLINWIINDNYDLWIIGEGTIIWNEAGTPLTITRNPGNAIPITSISPITIGTVSGNSYIDEATTTWSLQGISSSVISSIQSGQIYNLNSQDIYPWALMNVISGSGSGLLQVWQAQLVRIQGIAIPFSSGSNFLEDQTIIGSVSGSTAVIRSISGSTTGYIIASSISSAFVIGEQLLINNVNCGTVSGNAIVLIAEKIVDTYTTSPQIQLIVPCKTIIEGLAVDVPAGSNVDISVGVANRLPGIILGNCYEPSIKNVKCVTGWTRFIQSLGCWRGDYDIRVSYLPNDANLTEQAYGYGIELAGADTGSRVKIIATGCRHGFTTNVYWGGYIYMPLQSRGNPRDFLVYGSTVRSGFNAGFDTHWGCYNGRFENCVSDYANHVNRNVSASIGFQNRGFNTSYSDCITVGCTNGFVDGYSALGSPSPPSGQPVYQSKTIYNSCSAIDFQLNGFVVAVNNITDQNKQLYNNCFARGDGQAVNSPYYQSCFNFDLAAHVQLIGCTVERFNGTPIQIAGAGGRIEIADFYAYYRDNISVASGLRINGLPTEMYINNYRVYSNIANSTPSGLFRLAYLGTLNVGLSGFIGCINNSSVPLIDPSTIGTFVFSWCTNRITAANLTATGTNQSSAFAITAQVNTFTTVTSGSGAALPGNLAIGSEVIVFNRGANTLLIYPNGASQIESNGAGIAVSIVAGSSARFVLESTGQWRQQ